jgi:predicted acylesterase/phospholipase RssA
VLAGGGSFGAIQVGMLHALARHGVIADMVVGSSVGAINGAYYASDPTLKGILQLETIWRGPGGAVANALHALTLLSARQLVNGLESVSSSIEYFVVPPLCPLVGSPYDFSHSAEHIERAIASTDAWLMKGGLGQSAIPGKLRPHSH